MSQYFDHVTQQLHSKIKQAKVYITKHNPTTGALAEAVHRQFLTEHLPRWGEGRARLCDQRRWDAVKTREWTSSEMARS